VAQLEEQTGVCNVFDTAGFALLFKVWNHVQAESIEQQKRIGDLEQEMRKLSGQQNLQQRIQHHAKIKVCKPSGLTCLLCSAGGTCDTRERRFNCAFGFCVDIGSNFSCVQLMM
jgi:hypothetical protein